MKAVAVIVILGAGVGAAFGQSAPLVDPAAATSVAIDRDSGSRLPLLTRADMPDAASARTFDTLAGSGGKPPHGTMAIALYSPATAAALAQIDTYLHTESPLSPRQLELLVLVTAREISLAYEWSAHEPAALKAGVTPTVIDAVRRNEPVSRATSEDALLVDFGRQLFRERRVSSESFAALVQQLGKQQAFDAMMTIGYVAMSGLLQRAVDQQPPAGWNPADLPAIADVGTPNGRIGEFVALQSRPPLAADVDEESYYRWPLLHREEFESRGREIFDRVVGADKDKAPRGPVGMTLNSPEFADPIQQLNDALRMKGLLDRRLAEIVVTATGREMNSQYQWIVHGAAARDAGASAEVLEAIRVDGDLSALDERDAVAIALTRELFRENAVSSATFDAAVRLFGTRGAIEIAALVGDYLMMTTVYNALGMRLRPEQEPTLPHRVGAPVGAEWR